MAVNLRYLLPKKVYRHLFWSFVLVCTLLISIISLTVNLVHQSDDAKKFQIRTITTAHKIHYYDEVLTMSARMAAFTGNSDWNKRYQHHVVKLDEQLKEAVAIYPEATTIIKNISVANDRLVAAEERALDLADNGKLKAAQALLISPVYESNKHMYMSGLTALIHRLEGEQVRHQEEFRKLFFITVLVFVALLAALGFVIWKMINVLIQRLEIENALATVAKRLQTPRLETIDKDIRWILGLIADKAHADYVFLIRKRRGKHISIVNEWSVKKDDECNESQYKEVSAAVSELEPTEGNTAIFEPSIALIEMGFYNLISETLSNGSREYYQLCILNPQNKEFHWDKKDSSILVRFNEMIIRARNMIDSDSQK